MEIVKKLLILFLGSLCLLSGVNAITTTGNIGYWDFDSPNNLVDSSTTGNDLTNSGVTFQTGLINEQAVFDDSTDYLDTNYLGYDNLQGSISFWFNASAVSGDLFIAGDRGASGDYLHIVLTANNIDARMSSGSSYEVSGTTTLSANTLYHYVLTWGSSGLKAYLNGVSEGSNAYTGTWTSANGFEIGRIPLFPSSNQMSGTIEEFSIWNTQLTADNISDLYNSGNGFNPYASGGSTPTINHNVSNFYNSENISIALTTATNTNMSYYLDAGSEVAICSDCNSTTLNLNSLSEGSHSILFESTDSNGQVNSTANFTIDLTNPTINVLNTSQKETYSVTWSSVFNYSDTNLDSCWIIVENSTQNCISYTFTNNGNQTVQVYVNDSAGNVATSSFVILINPKVYIYFEEPSTTPISNFTLDGINYGDYAEFNVYDYGLGSHTLLFQNYGYALTNISLTLTATSSINTTETIQVALLYVNIRDRNTEALITQTVDFDLVGDSYSDSYTTATGQKTITDIKELPGTYRLSFTSSGYANNEYYFTHTGYSAVNITTYLINESLTIPVKIILRDIFGNPMTWTDTDGSEQGCIIKIKQHFIAINDYLSVDMGTTNSLGEIIFDLEYDKYYQFVAVCDGVTQTYPGQKITSTPLYLTFDEDQGLTVFDELPNIAGDVTWANLTNTTGYFRFEYDDADGIVSQGCLRVYEQAFSGDTLIDESCVSSASATINVLINYTTNKKYIGKGYATYNGEEHFIDSHIKSFYPGTEGWSAGVGLLGSVLVIMTLFLIGMALHPIGAVGFAWLGSYVMVKFGALGIPEGSVIGLGALLIGIVLFVRSR